MSEAVQEYASPHTNLWISDGYDDAAEIAAKVNSLLASTPSRLREAAERIFVMSSYPPKIKGLKEGVACMEGPDMFIWRVRRNGDRPVLLPVVIEHELAHASGDDGGPPPDLRHAWASARHADATHGEALASRLTNGQDSKGELKIAGGRALLLGSEWMTDYAARSSKKSDGEEDWAEAVEVYLGMQRLPGGVAHIGDEEIGFADIYPHRAKLVSDFLVHEQ